MVSTNLLSVVKSCHYNHDPSIGKASNYSTMSLDLDLFNQTIPLRATFKIPASLTDAGIFALNACWAHENLSAFKGSHSFMRRVKVAFQRLADNHGHRFSNA